MAVLLAWLASLGWLAVRRIDQTEGATLSTEASLRLSPGTVWYALYSGTTQIGNAGIALDTLSPGYRVSESISLEAPDGAALVRTTRRTQAWLGATLDLERLRSDYSRAGRQADWTVALSGDTVTAHFGSGALETRGISVLDEAPSAGIAMAYRLALGGGLAPGQHRSVRLLDGWPIAAGSAQIAVGRDSVLHFADSARVVGPERRWVVAHTDSVRAWAVTMVAAGGPRRLWIDHRGAISGIETPFGVRWVRTDFDLSETAFRARLPGQTDAIRNAVPVLAAFAGSRARRDTGTAERRFVVQHRDGSPVDLALLGLLSGGRQLVQGDTVIILAAPVRGPGESLRDTTPDPMIQENAAAIQRVQRELVNRPLNRDRLPALIDAVHGLVRVDTSADAAEDALGTLARRAGRPDGVARLFVALLRASGVPSRYVVGVYPRGDALLTHAWAEIWSETAGGWYAVDPVSGTAAANTGLIRLAFGGSSAPEEMMMLLANARLTELPGKEQP